jgi:hypothetical protein
MGSQTVGNVHINGPLTNLSRLYRPKGFIAPQVCPQIPVVKESDKYYVFDQGPYYATDVDDLVADRAKPRKVEMSHSTEQYLCQKRELAWDISDRERRNADSQLNLERNKQNGTLGRLLLKHEIRVAALLRKTTNGGGLNLGTTAAVKWDGAAVTYAGIATDVMIGRAAMRQAAGVVPNKIVIPAAVAEGMHKSLLYQILQYTYGDSQARLLMEQPFPALPPVLFGMDVIIAGEIYNSAVEGQTASYSDIWGEAVRMLYVTSGPALEEPSAAYTLVNRPLQTRQWRDEEAEVDSYAVGWIVDEKVVAPDAGYEISDCLT